MTDLTPRRAKPQTFLTVIPARNQREKLHATRGLGLSAIKAVGREGALYEMRDGEWVLLCTAHITYVKSEYGNWKTAQRTIAWEEGEEP